MMKVNSLTVATTLLAVRTPVLAKRAYAQFNASPMDKSGSKSAPKYPHFRGAPEPLKRCDEVITPDIKYPPMRYRFEPKQHALIVVEPPQPFFATV